MDAPARMLTLYAREWCHLCDDMHAALAPYRQPLGFDVDIVFIDGDDDLETRFGSRVPVLADERGAEICHYFLDAAALRAHLAGGS